MCWSSQKKIEGILCTGFVKICVLSQQAFRIYILLHIIKKHYFIHFYCLLLKSSKAFSIFLSWVGLDYTFSPLSANSQKLSNTLKQFVGNRQRIIWIRFDHFVGLVLKGLTCNKSPWIWCDILKTKPLIIFFLTSNTIQIGGSEFSSYEIELRNRVTQYLFTRYFELKLKNTRSWKIKRFTSGY